MIRPTGLPRHGTIDVVITVLEYLVIAAAIGLVVFFVAALVFGRGEQMAPLPARTSPAELPDGAVAGADLRGVRFAVGVRGYRMSDVDWTLERAADELDRLRAQVTRLGGDPDADARTAGQVLDDSGNPADPAASRYALVGAGAPEPASETIGRSGGVDGPAGAGTTGPAVSRFSVFGSPRNDSRPPVTGRDDDQPAGRTIGGQAADESNGRDHAAAVRDDQADPDGALPTGNGGELEAELDGRMAEHTDRDRMSGPGGGKPTTDHDGRDHAAERGGQPHW